MNKSRTWLCFLATALTAAGVQNAGRCEDVDTGFYETAQQHFSEWDLNHDGSLSPKEIEEAFRSTKYTGKAAAAISVLKKIETIHFSHNEPLQSFTMEQINEMQNKGNPRKKANKKVFEKTLKKIDEASPKLFAHGLPKIDEIIQGGTNDCWFLSSLGALVLAHPEQLAKMIEPNADGSSFTVHFFGVKPVKVGRPSSGEIAGYNSNGGDGIWLAVMLKAYGKLQMQTTGQYKEIPLDPVERTVVHGGIAGRVVPLLTGHRPSTKKIKEMPDLRKQLSEAFENKRLVIVDVPGHFLTGVAYDHNSDQLKIWNPWGTTGTYKMLGAEMQHGYFSVPISEVKEKVRSITFETTENSDSDKGRDEHHNHHHG